MLRLYKIHSYPISRFVGSRRFSVAAHQTTEQESAQLLHPAALANGTIPYPKALSPSSIMEFQACPQSFLFQYLYNIRAPTNEVLARGSMVHKALEQIYAIDREERTLDVLQNLLRHEWSKCRKSDTYRHLFEDSIDEERVWGQSCLRLLENYVSTENPMLTPDPAQRETWVKALLSVDPQIGVTSPRRDMTTSAKDQERFLVRGIVDRIDLVREQGAERSVVSRIVDYKTGKAPHLKYTHDTNQQILDDKFFQLKIYALLMREMSSKASVNVRYLRLFHLTNHREQAEYLDFDLGATQAERDAELNQVHGVISKVWQGITDLVSVQDPLAFTHCDRSFCYCHTCRTRFVPGTVYERGTTSLL